MRVNREALLRCLEAVSPGLAKREIVEQSACFVFSGNDVITFNDEVACRLATPVTGVQGAVQAKPLLALLAKLVEDDIDITQSEAELLIKGKGRRAGIRMEKEVLLPVDTIDKVEAWYPLPTDFGDAVATVQDCAGTDDNQFAMTCIHITPDYLEACDNFQIVRFPIKTGMGQNGSARPDMLVRRDSLRQMVGLDMTEFAESPAWLHFRNPAGLVYSCRRYLEDYPALDDFLTMEGEQTTLPGGLGEAVAKAQIASDESAGGGNLLVDLKPGWLILEGRGAIAWYQERIPVVYSGQPVKFMIAPKLLIEIPKRKADCRISAGRLSIDGGRFIFAACLAVARA